MRYVLSIDQGTSSTRSIIFDEDGNVKGVFQKEHRQYYPHEAWVEHDPNEIKNSVLETVGKSIKSAAINWNDIKAIGITNQRETVVAWDKNTSIPLAKAIVWQCRRSVPIVDQLKADGYEELFHKKTGLVLDAYFSGTKMKWMLENNQKILDKSKTDQLAFGTIDSWIIQFLANEHNTDASNASRTLLYSLNKNSWSEELCEILKIPMSSLPDIKPNAGSESFGFYEVENNQIPIRGVLGDQQAALFGQTGFVEGNIKTTYGTGNFTLLNTGYTPKFSSNGLLTTVGWDMDGKLTYALEGSVFITGAAIQWLRDNLEIIDSYDEVDKIAGQTENSGGVFFVPAFVGLGAPYWDSSARGLIIGLTLGTTKSHLIRAAIDSIAFQTEDLLNTMKKDTNIDVTSMRVDGGITKSNLLMQRQADISQININRPKNIETTALGVGMMAGYELIWDTFDDLAKLNQTEKEFNPKLVKSDIKNEIEKWKTAVSRSRNWI